MWVLDKDQPMITRYRPRTLDEVLGNENIKEFFQDKLQHPLTFPRSTFFFGDPGCGKTTLSMVLGRALGCPSEIRVKNGVKEETLYGFHHFKSKDYYRGRGMDKVDQINKFLDAYNLFGAQIVVYLFDEAHYLDARTRTALYPLLERPTPGVYFFFCTTDLKPFRGDEAFNERCQEFEVRALEDEDRKSFIKWVCKEERKNLPKDEIRRIMLESRGIPRNILKMLDEAFVRY